MKKPALKKRVKRHDSTVAPPTNSLNISKMQDSPRCSTKSEKPETWGRGKFFVAVLKIFFLVVVALVTKRTVVSVSMCAFSLFFLEHVVKYLYGLFKYLIVTRTMKKTASFSSIEGDYCEGDGVTSDGSSLNVSSEEMQYVQAESGSDIGVPLDLNFDCKKRLELEDIDSSRKVTENDENCNFDGSSSTKRRGYRRAKLKSKIKKLVPKKLRNSMKKRSGSKLEDPVTMKEDNHEVKEYETELDDEKENISVSASDYCELMSESEESVVEAKPQRQTDKRILILDYWLVSFIVLAGLVEGQSLAVVLTVAWCLIMKLVARLHKKK